MTIAIILVLISADRGEGLAKKVRQFSRGQAVSRTPLAIVYAARLNRFLTQRAGMLEITQQGIDYLDQAS
jgi:hypothetical protein